MSSPQNKPQLHIDWCDYKAAKFAVMNWHYSKKMPIGKMVKIGVWEDSKFIGAVLFGVSNSPHLGTAYGLKGTEVCELVRVALKDDHKSPVSQIVMKAIKMLKIQSPGLRLIVSFADPYHGHNGSIYQAMNWVFVGSSNSATQWLYDGEWVHNRTMGGSYGSKPPVADISKLPTRKVPGKYRYLYPLDKKMKRAIKDLAKPYPKRDE